MSYNTKIHFQSSLIHDLPIYLILVSHKGIRIMKKTPLHSKSLIDDDGESLANKPYINNILSSHIGRIIQKATYFDLIIGAVLIILFSSILIQITGVLNPIANYTDALYFCFVTFTTLGYGDFAPIGFARFISVFLTLCGLLFTTLLIGKFASERQQAMLLLLHTSDCQRRIDSFCEELLLISTKLRNTADIPQMKKLLKELTSRFEASSNYVIFHANQSNLTGFGNDSALMNFYYVISHIQESCYLIHMKKPFITDEIIFNRSFALVKRTCSLINIMYKLHIRSMKNYGYIDTLLIGIRHNLVESDISNTSPSKSIHLYVFIKRFIYKQIGRFTEKKEYDENHSLLIGIRKIKKKMQERLKEIIIEHKTNLNHQLLNEVYNLMPIGEKESWGKGINKVIATKLQISGRLAQKAINLLITQKKLPRHPLK